MTLGDLKDLDDLEVEFPADNGKGGKKTVKMRWLDFIKSDLIPKEYRIQILEAKSRLLGENKKK